MNIIKALHHGRIIRLHRTSANVCIIIMTLLGMMTCITSCTGGGNDKLPSEYDGNRRSIANESYDNEDEVVLDEADQEAEDKTYIESSSDECKAAIKKITDLKDEVEAVKSPGALIRCKKTYSKKLSDAKAALSQISDEEELQLATRYIDDAESKYAELCRSMELPSDGILVNLRELTDELNKISTKEALDYFIQLRYGMLQDLDYIHLAVHEGDHIAEIRTAASGLRNLLIKKKQQFGIND